MRGNLPERSEVREPIRKAPLGGASGGARMNLLIDGDCVTEECATHLIPIVRDVTAEAEIRREFGESFGRADS